MHFHRFSSMGSYNGKRGPAAPIETFARFQAGFLSFEDFHRFLSIVIDFMISIDCWACYACWACWTVWFLGFVGMEDCPTGSNTLDAQERSADYGYWVSFRNSDSHPSASLVEPLLSPKAFYSNCCSERL